MFSVPAWSILDEPLPEWLNHELTASEMNAIVSIQKIARGYLQRRILLTRTPGTEKNLQVQQALQTSLVALKADVAKSAGLLFR